jgi:tRNA pseudouridine55 synthase
LIQKAKIPEQGFYLIIDKPLGLTSFQVVKKIRYLIKQKTGIKKAKVGHAGTLDPLASGILILCIGKMTKQIDTFQASTKVYSGIFELGATTPSFDLETEINQTFDISNITEKEIYAVARSLEGEQNQKAPDFSAKKINGVRAYEMARKGIDPQIKKHIITVEKFEITKINLPEIHFEITCSKGTYIRSLANDFGLRLNNGAYLKKLVREKSGEFELKDALNFENINETLDQYLITE